MALHPGRCNCDSCLDSLDPVFCDSSGEPYTDLPPFSTGHAKSEPSGIYPGQVDPTAFGRAGRRTLGDSTRGRGGPFGDRIRGRGGPFGWDNGQSGASMAGVVYQSLTQFPPPTNPYWLHPTPAQVASVCQIACLQASLTNPCSQAAGQVETSSDGVSNPTPGNVVNACAAALAPQPVQSCAAAACSVAATSALTTTQALSVPAQSTVNQLSQAAASPSGIAPTLSANGVNVPAVTAPAPKMSTPMLVASGVLLYLLMRK